MRYIALMMLMVGSFALAEERREVGLVQGCWCVCKAGTGLKSVFIPSQLPTTATHADCQKKLRMAGSEELSCPGGAIAGTLLSATCSLGYGPTARE